MALERVRKNFRPASCAVDKRILYTASAKFYHPIEKGNYYVTTERESARRCAKNVQHPETKRIHKATSIDSCKKEIGPVFNIEIATIMDVPGIEVQVPSLSSPGYSVRMLISRGHERFVN